MTFHILLLPDLGFACKLPICFSRFAVDYDESNADLESAGQLAEYWLHGTTGTAPSSAEIQNHRPARKLRCLHDIFD